MTIQAQSAPTVRGTHSAVKLRIATLGAALSCLGAIALYTVPDAGATPVRNGKVDYAKRVNLRKQSRKHHTRTATTPVTSTPSPSPAPAPAPKPAPTPAPKPTPTPTPTPKPTPIPVPTPTPTPTPVPTPTPTPVPTPTPTPVPSASSIFSGSKIKDFGLTQAAPGAITEVADPLGSGEQTLKMTVSSKDVAPVTPTENPRAQLLTKDVIKNGNEFWLQTKFMLPADFPSSVPGWMALVEIYGEPFNGSSPWQIDIEGNHISWTRNRTYKYDTPWQMPIVKGRWITVLLHERFASDGFTEMWIDGEPVKFFSDGTYNPSKVAPTEHLAMATMDSSNNGSSGNAAKIMNYRQAGMFDSTTIYFGALRIGTTRASVGG
jgi:outer membrane biosynthesis protein TonB